MKSYSRLHLSDGALLRDLSVHISQERSATAEVLADIGEVDARRLYAPAGYDSMFRYCVQHLHLSEDAAYKRIQAARAAREFPEILAALAEGRLHLSGVCLLTPHLKPENAAKLLEAAAGKSKAQIELMVAQIAPRPDLPARIVALGPAVGGFADAAPGLLAPGQVESAFLASASESPSVAVAAAHEGPVEQRYGVQFTIGGQDLELLERAQDLLGFLKPDEIGEVFVRALRAFVPQLEKRKLGASDKPRRRKHESNDPRHIPACVRRAVHERDGGRCTFVAESGRRCQARRGLEYDHIEPVARGGRSVTSNLRLRCRAHNQLEAEQVFGKSFMQAKREASGETAAKKRAEEIVPWLRALGIRADHAAQAAEGCGPMTGATLEERVKAALRQFGPRDVCLSRAAPA